MRELSKCHTGSGPLDGGAFPIDFYNKFDSTTLLYHLSGLLALVGILIGHHGDDVTQEIGVPQGRVVFNMFCHQSGLLI